MFEEGIPGLNGRKRKKWSRTRNFKQQKVVQLEEKRQFKRAHWEIRAERGGKTKLWRVLKGRRAKTGQEAGGGFCDSGACGGIGNGTLFL